MIASFKINFICKVTESEIEFEVYNFETPSDNKILDNINRILKKQLLEDIERLKIVLKYRFDMEKIKFEQLNFGE